MKASITCHNPQQAHTALTQSLWPQVKSWLICNDGVLQITCKPQTRTSDQNAKFHSICSDIAKSDVNWAGKRRTAAQWKVLLVSGHAVVTKEESEIVPGLENEFVSIRESTALMSIKRGSSLIEYSLAFADMHDVRLSASEEVTQ